MASINSDRADTNQDAWGLWIGTLLIACSVLLPSSSIAEQSGTGNTHLKIIYTGRLAGEIEPCGCTAEGDLGGIRRLATVVDRLRVEDDERILIGSGDVLGTLQPAHRVSNEFILQGLASLDYDAIGLHWGDLIYNAEYISTASLPWVVSNWRPPDLAPFRQIDGENVSVVYLNWLAPKLSPYRDLPPEHERVHGDLDQLRRLLGEFRQQGLVTILGTFGMTTPLDRLPLELIDVLILPVTADEYAPPQRIADTWVLHPGSRGQYVAEAQFKRDPDDGWDLHSHQIIPLDESVADSPGLSAWYDEYTAALDTDFERRRVQALASSKHGEYVGMGGCEACHLEQVGHWRSTDHAHALASLVAVGKNHDANCVVCHAVVSGKASGLSSALALSDLRGVSCEACHGPARQHVESGGSVSLTPISEAVCTRCHTRAQSPGFDLQSYWPHVKH